MPSGRLVRCGEERLSSAAHNFELAAATSAVQLWPGAKGLSLVKSGMEKTTDKRTLELCRFEIQAKEIKCSWRRKDASSQPVVVEDRVTGERHALPLQVSGKAKTSAAAIVEVDVCGLAGWCQNHGSC